MLASLKATAWLRLALGATAALAIGCARAAEPARGVVADQVAAAIAGGTASFEHSSWNELLQLAIHDGLVDYDVFAAHRAELDRYLERVGQVDLAALERDQLMALLINAYNAYTIRSILEHPHVASIREIDGVWDRRTHLVGGFDLTLDNLEHNLLRPYFRDPRIHVAVNCAARSCPPLAPWAFRGEALDAQLEERTTAFFRDPRFTRLERETLYLSALLDWYGKDFIDAQAQPRADSLPEFVKRYASEELATRLEQLGPRVEIRFLDYDWALNRASGQK